MLTLASPSERVSSPSVPWPVLHVDHEHLALVGEKAARLFQRLARGLGLLVVEQQMDHAPSLAGERAHPLDVDPGLARCLAQARQLARPVLEHHCEVR